MEEETAGRRLADHPQTPQCEAPTLTLTYEWDVPALPSLKLGSPGISYVKDQQELHTQALSMRGNPCKVALLCPIRSEPPRGVIWRVSKTAFHATTQFQRHGQEQVHLSSKVAFLYQLHSSENVQLRTKTPTTTAGHSVSTEVLKLVAHRRFTPPVVWASLEQGRNKPFSEQLLKDIAELNLPSGSVQDLFQLQLS